MYVVIFRATVAEFGEGYTELAGTLRDRALREYGCLEFVSYMEGDQEVALSYWPDEKSILAWKAEVEHLVAQALGRERFYSAYRVQVARVERDYVWPGPDAVGDPG